MRIRLFCGFGPGSLEQSDRFKVHRDLERSFIQNCLRPLARGRRKRAGTWSWPWRRWRDHRPAVAIHPSIATTWTHSVALAHHFAGRQLRLWSSARGDHEIRRERGDRFGGGYRVGLHINVFDNKTVRRMEKALQHGRQFRGESLKLN